MALHRAAEGLLETERDPAGAAADTAGEVDDKRGVRRELLAEGIELGLEATASNGVTGEQTERVLVVDEERRSGFGSCAL